jgi:hypothetical protein
MAEEVPDRSGRRRHRRPRRPSTAACRRRADESRPADQIEFVHPTSRFRLSTLGLIGDTRRQFVKQKPPIYGADSERMIGLEPTTFCMASARDVRTRSRPFAQTGLIPGSSSERANATEPERTTNLAILATPRSEAKRLRREDAGAGRWLRHRPDSSSGARLLWLAMLRTRR